MRPGTRHAQPLAMALALRTPSQAQGTGAETATAAAGRVWTLKGLALQDSGGNGQGGRVITQTSPGSSQRASGEHPTRRRRRCIRASVASLQAACRCKQGIKMERRYGGRRRGGERRGALPAYTGHGGRGHSPCPNYAFAGLPGAGGAHAHRRGRCAGADGSPQAERHAAGEGAGKRLGRCAPEGSGEQGLAGKRGASPRMAARDCRPNCCRKRIKQAARRCWDVHAALG